MKFKEWVKATHQALASGTPENRQRQFSQAEVSIVLRQSLSVLAQSLQSGGDLRLNDIGRLWVEQKAPRKVANNLTGQGTSHRLAERKVVRFRASTRLLTHLNPSSSEIGQEIPSENESA